MPIPEYSGIGIKIMKSAVLLKGEKEENGKAVRIAFYMNKAADHEREADASGEISASTDDSQQNIDTVKNMQDKCHDRPKYKYKNKPSVKGHDRVPQRRQNANVRAHADKHVIHPESAV